ncbi:MAG: YbaK/EbsC family protein [Clostridia bacterium]|nr:YbaK/EbsC family protein [Clostridia bacterium]
MSIEKVKNYLKQFNLENKVIELTESSATVELAAKALGCKGQQIAKTMSFDVEGNTILVLLAGDSKVDNAKYKSTFGVKAKMLGFDEVESRVGHKVGGVCPFAINENIKVYLDVSLKRFNFVYPAAGNANSAVKLTLTELELASKYISWVDVGKIIE